MKYPTTREATAADLPQLELLYKRLPHPRTSTEEAVLARIRQRLKEKGGPNVVESGAYHESGHAVAATVQGFEVTLISILDINNERCEFEVPDPPTWDSAQKEIITNLAGLIAQYRKYPKSCRHWHSFQDDRETNSLVEHFGLDWQRLQEDTVNIVETHWPTIEHLAQELLLRKELAGAEIRRIIGSVNPQR